MSEILSKALSSVSLLRTNPKLSGNVKLSVDTDGKATLNSFDANTELTRNVYKGLKINPNGSYDQDLYRFLQNGNTPNEIFFDLKTESVDSVSIKADYGQQYDPFYWYGAELLVSDLFDEEYRILAPLWLKPIIPDYFVIFKVPEPVAVSAFRAIGNDELVLGVEYGVIGDKFVIEHDGNTYQSGDVFKASTNEYTVINESTDEFARVYINDENNAASLVRDPERFQDQILNNAELIAQYDLSENSEVGRYIRKYFNKDGFPRAPLFANFDNTKNTTYNGVSTKFGGFVQVPEDFNDFWREDRTITEFDEFVTEGFERNGVVVANLLNLEFLFNDETSEDFTINRYFGLYVNAIDLGTFNLDEARLKETYRLPQNFRIDRPFDRTISSDDGVQFFSGNDPRGILFDSEKLRTTPSFCYVKDKKSTFHSIKTQSEFSSYDYILQDKEVNIKDFTGFDDSFREEEASKIFGDDGLKASVVLSVNRNPKNGDELVFSDERGVLARLYFDRLPNESNFGAGDSLGGYYVNPDGRIVDVANAIAKAIEENDTLRIYFDAISDDDDVFIVSRRFGRSENRFKVQVNTDEQDTIETNTPNNNFIGGSDRSQSAVIVDSQIVDTIPENSYVKTERGFSRIVSITPYYQEPIKDETNDIIGFNNLKELSVLNIEDQNETVVLNSGRNVLITKQFNPVFGVFSLFPVADFDVDFLSNQYSKSLDGELTEFFNVQSGQILAGERYVVIDQNNTTGGVIEYNGKYYGDTIRSLPSNLDKLITTAEPQRTQIITELDQLYPYWRETGSFVDENTPEEDIKSVGSLEIYFDNLSDNTQISNSFTGALDNDGECIKSFRVIAGNPIVLRRDYLEYQYHNEVLKLSDATQNVKDRFFVPSCDYVDLLEIPTFDRSYLETINKIEQTDFINNKFEYDVESTKPYVLAFNETTEPNPDASTALKINPVDFTYKEKDSHTESTYGQSTFGDFANAVNLTFKYVGAEGGITLSGSTLTYIPASNESFNTGGKFQVNGYGVNVLTIEVNPTSNSVAAAIDANLEGDTIFTLNNVNTNNTWTLAFLSGNPTLSPNNSISIRWNGSNWVEVDPIESINNDIFNGVRVYTPALEGTSFTTRLVFEISRTPDSTNSVLNDFQDDVFKNLDINGSYLRYEPIDGGDTKYFVLQNKEFDFGRNRIFATFVDVENTESLSYTNGLVIDEMPDHTQSFLWTIIRDKFADELDPRLGSDNTWTGTGTSVIDTSTNSLNYTTGVNETAGSGVGDPLQINGVDIDIVVLNYGGDVVGTAPTTQYTLENISSVLDLGGSDIILRNTSALPIDILNTGNITTATTVASGDNVYLELTGTNWQPRPTTSEDFPPFVVNALNQPTYNSGERVFVAYAESKFFEDYQDGVIKTGDKIYREALVNLPIELPDTPQDTFFIKVTETTDENYKDPYLIVELFNAPDFEVSGSLISAETLYNVSINALWTEQVTGALNGDNLINISQETLIRLDLTSPSEACWKSAFKIINLSKGDEVTAQSNAYLFDFDEFEAKVFADIENYYGIRAVKTYQYNNLTEQFEWEVDWEFPYIEPISSPSDVTSVFSSVNLESELREFVGFFTLHKIEDVDTNQTFSDNADEKFLQLAQGKLKSEYERLRELQNKELFTTSKVVPYINKWVLKNGTDIRDNEYRLNNNDVFGILNFSPSFTVKRQDPDNFTHEWYYLENNPRAYLSASVDDNYFDYPFDLNAHLTNPFFDYFSDYFTNTTYREDVSCIERCSVVLNPDNFTYEFPFERFDFNHENTPQFTVESETISRDDIREQYEDGLLFQPNTPKGRWVNPHPEIILFKAEKNTMSVEQWNKIISLDYNDNVKIEVTIDAYGTRKVLRLMETYPIHSNTWGMLFEPTDGSALWVRPELKVLHFGETEPWNYEVPQQPLDFELELIRDDLRPRILYAGGDNILNPAVGNNFWGVSGNFYPLGLPTDHPAYDASGIETITLGSGEPIYPFLINPPRFAIPNEGNLNLQNGIGTGYEDILIKIEPIRIQDPDNSDPTITIPADTLKVVIDPVDNYLPEAKVIPVGYENILVQNGSLESDLTQIRAYKWEVTGTWTDDEPKSFYITDFEIANPNNLITSSGDLPYTYTLDYKNTGGTGLQIFYGRNPVKVQQPLLKLHPYVRTNTKAPSFLDTSVKPTFSIPYYPLTNPAEIQSLKYVDALANNLTQAGTPISGTDTQTPNATVGDVFVYTTSGTTYATDGIEVNVGDSLVCITNNTAGVWSATGDNFQLLRKDVDGAIYTNQIDLTGVKFKTEYPPSNADTNSKVFDLPPTTYTFDNDEIPDAYLVRQSEILDFGLVKPNSTVHVIDIPAPIILGLPTDTIDGNQYEWKYSEVVLNRGRITIQAPEGKGFNVNPTSDLTEVTIGDPIFVTVGNPEFYYNNALGSTTKLKANDIVLNETSQSLGQFYTPKMYDDYDQKIYAGGKSLNTPALIDSTSNGSANALTPKNEFKLEPFFEINDTGVFINDRNYPSFNHPGFSSFTNPLTGKRLYYKIKDSSFNSRLKVTRVDVVSSGSGYTDGVYTDIPVTGGTFTQQATVDVIVGGGVITQLSVNKNGMYTELPTSPTNTAAFGGGSGLTLSLTSDFLIGEKGFLLYFQNLVLSQNSLKSDDKILSLPLNLDASAMGLIGAPSSYTIEKTDPTTLTIKDGTKTITKLNVHEAKIKVENPAYYSQLRFVDNTNNHFFLNGSGDIPQKLYVHASEVEIYQTTQESDFVITYDCETVREVEDCIQEKYALFEYDDNLGFSSCFHRGVKILAKRRVETDTEFNFNIDDIEVIENDTRFDNYKFSSLLRITTNPKGEVKEPYRIQVIENKRYDNIMMLVEIFIEDYKVLNGSFDVTQKGFRTQDIKANYLSLYTLQSLKWRRDHWNNYLDEYVFGLPEVVDIWTNSGPGVAGIDNSEKFPFYYYGVRLNNRFNWASAQINTIETLETVDNSYLSYQVNTIPRLVIDETTNSQSTRRAYGSIVFYYRDEVGGVERIVGRIGARGYKFLEPFNPTPPTKPYNEPYQIPLYEYKVPVTPLPDEFYDSADGTIPAGIPQQEPISDVLNRKTLNGDSLVNLEVFENNTNLVQTKYNNFISYSNLSSVQDELIYVYEDGGREYYSRMMEEISFGNIAELVNNGSPKIEYISVDFDLSTTQNVITRNEFLLEFLPPDVNYLSTRLDVIQDTDKPTELSFENLIGYTTSETQLSKPRSYQRYSEWYEPKFREVFCMGTDNVPLTWDYAVSFWNKILTNLEPNPETIERLKDDFITSSTQTPFNNYNRNTAEELFDSFIVDQVTYKELDGCLAEIDNPCIQLDYKGLKLRNTKLILNDGFGKIDNLWYNKVNENNQDLLRLSGNEVNPPRYPILDETAISNRDYYVFESNWDSAYNRKFIKPFNQQPIIGTRSAREHKSFMASKSMKIPERVVLEKLDLIQVPDLNLISVQQLEDNDGFFNLQNDILTVRLYIKDRLIEEFFDETLAEFSNYINPKWSEGELDSIKDDVYAYLERNIIPAYQIGDVNVFVRTQKQNQDSLGLVEGNLTDVEKFNAGLVPRKAARSSKIDDFTIELVYTLKQNFYNTLSFSVEVNRI